MELVRFFTTITQRLTEMEEFIEVPGDKWTIDISLVLFYVLGHHRDTSNLSNREIINHFRAVDVLRAGVRKIRGRK